MLGLDLSPFTLAREQALRLPRQPVITRTSGAGFAGSTYLASRADVEWLADGVPIAGAIGPSFTRSVLHEGAEITCRAGGEVSAPIPPAYSLPEPILLEGFEALSGFSAMGGASLSLGTQEVAQGSHCLAIVGSASAAGNLGFERSLPNALPSSLGTLAFLTARRSEASVGAGWWYMYREGATEFLSMTSASSFPMGWRWNAAHISEFATLNAATSVGGVKMRFMHQNTSPFGGALACDALYAQAGGRPTILFTFDDQWDTHRTAALPILQAAGFKGTAYASPGLLGSGGVKSTTAQLQALYAAGWDIACDSWVDANLVTGKTTAEAVAEVISIRDWLVENGMPRAANHGTWPFGQFSEALIEGLFAQGFLTFRAGGMAPGFLSRFGIPRATRANLPCRQLNQTSGTLAQALTDLDRAILRGETLIYSLHDLREAPSSVGWMPAQFQTLVDAVKAKVDQGLVSVITQSELWLRDGARGLPA